MIVFPWDDSPFEGTPSEKEMVYSNLKRVGFDTQRWKALPSQEIVEATGKVLPGILEKKWQLICSNSVELLQAIANLCPIIFSLSTKDSSLMVTTDRVIGWLQSELEDDDWGRGNLKLVRTCGLLSWFDVSQPHSSGNKYHYKMADLLLRRNALGYPTIFLCIFIPQRGKKFDGDSVELIYDKIRMTLGDTAASIIQEVSRIQFFETEIKPKELVRFKL